MVNRLDINLKKSSIICSLVLCLMVSFVNAETISSKIHKSQIEYIDNTKGIVVINDQQYKLRLNSKVTDTNNRKLNRYALKVGQKVKLKSSYENKTNFVDAIVIVSK